MFKSSLNKIISVFEIDPTDVGKKKEYRSLSELVTILFAVIFGVGLSQLGGFKNGYDLGVLILGYVAVMLSWWGYNWGIIVRPETNILNYAIDMVLIANYWWLINIRAPMGRVVLGYFIMFGLYWLWEVIRKYSHKMPQINKAEKLNFTFFMLAGVLLLVYKCLWQNLYPDSLLYLILLFLLSYLE